MRNSSPRRSRRSVHFVPGANEKMLTKSLDGEADTLVLDLEDSVVNQEKNQAREIVSDWLANVDFGQKEVCVRINPIDTPWGLADIERLMDDPPHLLMIPKADRVTNLQVIESEITRLETPRKDGKEQVGLLLICNETPQGVERQFDVATLPRVVALSWGAEDLASAIGSTRNRDESGSYLDLYGACRNQTLVAAVANGVQPIDTVYVLLDDESGLQEDCKIASAMGFTGKLTIHPNQIPIVNEAFTPALEDVRRARRLIEAFEEVQQEGKQALRFEGKMVDVPHLNQAQALIKRATEIGIS